MEKAPVQRRLSAVLVADIVGYSLMVDADEAGTIAAVRDRWTRILVPLVAENDGRIVKFLGDGALVEFSSAVRAVECALELQKVMAATNENEAEPRKIVLRIGINLGDVIPDGSDIFGEGVNIAARLEPLAKAGEICLAGNVYDAVRGKIKLSDEDLGELDLKNISRPVRAFRVSASDAAGESTVLRSVAENPLSIAVLPFDNMSGVPEHGYIGDGIAENIITDLSRFRDISVLARNSSFAYKGKPTRIQDMRRELGVNYILEGSVQRAGDRIRVTAQLINAIDGRHLWAERYDRRVDDLFAVMDEVTELIVGTLGATNRGRLRKSASEVVERGNQSSFQSFEHFVLGMLELNKFTESSISRSIVHFEQAIESNPRFAKALAKVAWAHLMNRAFGWGGDEAASLEQAQTFADLAIWADDSEAWAHWAAAGCALSLLKHDLALESMRRAIELNPNDADVLTDMGIFCSFAGMPDEGLIYALKAIRLNPHHPEYYADQLGQIYFNARQYENAIRTFEGIRSINTPSIVVYFAASQAALANTEAARSLLAALLKLQPSSSVSYWSRLSPYREDRDREHLAANLRLAGLPE